MPQATYPAVRIEIRPSIILPGEIGVFAMRRIAKDEIIVLATHFADARLVEWSVFDRLDALTKRKIMGYCPGTAEGFFAPPDLNYISVAWQINHSCEPNVGFNGRDDFVAMRAIKPAEELCWDYAFDESNPKFRMRCRCGSLRCRGMVTGSDWQLLVHDPDCRKYFSAGLRRHVGAAEQIVPPPAEVARACRGGDAMARRAANGLARLRRCQFCSRLHAQRCSSLYGKSRALPRDVIRLPFQKSIPQ